MHPHCPRAVHGVLLLALAGPSIAQCSTLANTPPGTDLQLGDDQVRTVGLGFVFPFHGINYSTISVASNGFVWLGEVTEDQLMLRAIDWIDNETDLLRWAPRIAVCWDDWNPESAQLQPGGGVFFHTDGASASVAWKGVPRNVAPPSLVPFANMELVLDSSGNIFLRYGAAMGVSDDGCIVGISAGDGATGNAIDWTTAVPGPIANGTGYQVFAPASFDLVGQTIQLAPQSTAALSHVAIAGSLATCPPAVPTPLAAAPVAFGTGCPGLVGTNHTAIYELFTPSGGANPPDLTGQSISFLRSGSVYVAVPGPGFDSSYTTHGQLLPQEDETIARGLSVGPMGSFPFSTLQVGTIDAASNGYLLLQPGGDSQWLPTVADFLAGPARIAPHWSDYDLYYQGTFYWSNDDPAFCMATWVAVEEFALPGVLSTFQCKLWANGDITFSYGSVTSQLDDVLVGITLGHGATTLGPNDISSAPQLPLLRDLGTLQLPLAHTASGPASIRAPITLRATNLPTGTGLGAFVVSQTPQALDLGSIGMPGCTAYVAIDDIYFTAAANAALTQTFVVPPAPYLIGLVLHTQAAAFAPLNPTGIVTSNRLTLTIGL